MLENYKQFTCSNFRNAYHSILKIIFGNVRSPDYLGIHKVMVEVPSYKPMIEKQMLMLNLQM